MTNDKTFVRRRERRKKKPAWWLPYRWEILAAAALLGGVLLIVGTGGFRTRLLAFVSMSAQVLRGGMTRLDSSFNAFLARLSVSDVVGVALVLFALGLILERVRRRVLSDPALANLQCPRCGGAIHRVHRTGLDRLISRFVPVRRYTCAATGCKWKGLRVGSGHRTR